MVKFRTFLQGRLLLIELSMELVLLGDLFDCIKSFAEAPILRKTSTLTVIGLDELVKAEMKKSSR